MSRNLLVAISCLALFAVAACGEELPQATPGTDACTAGQVRSCYSGPEGTRGVGSCQSGNQRCVDGKWSQTCEGEVLPLDGSCTFEEPKECEGEKNACGGCATLANVPGDRCAACGTLQCDGTEALKCTPPTNRPGDTCSTGGCTGTWTCKSDGSVVCEGSALNACGVCQGPQLDGLGSACKTAENCDGTKSCATDGLSLACTGPVKNVCGKCGGPALLGLGEDCLTTDGDSGKISCNATGDDTECKTGGGVVVPGGTGVVISEVAAEGPSHSDDEFVELHNPTAQAVSLDGYKLWYRSATGTDNQLIYAFAANQSIAAGGYFLVGQQTSYAGTVLPDAKTLLKMGANGGQVWLLNNPAALTAGTAVNAAGVADMVGWGTANKYEGSGTVAKPAKTGSMERKALATSDAASMGPGGADELSGNGHDSNDNKADFVLRTVRNPQNSSSATEP